MNFKKWVKSIQTAGYNGARTVDCFGHLYIFFKTLASQPWICNCFSYSLKHFFPHSRSETILRTKYYCSYFCAKKGEKYWENNWWSINSFSMKVNLRFNHRTVFSFLFCLDFDGLWFFLFPSKCYRKKKTCRNVLKWNFHTTITIA